ncbi:glycosyltransferase family 1 protein [Ramlibacter sp. USB13]|uniref:Glycosyltransferase family 1 protein n=1 Tax=Ramlibacter cellulosilyticus TaxID=2764187 RepID=A0A923MUG5_9BURK|nr:glycosyltransferase [Ramlibacter cellulosilyticus]MBC5785615.1 glycosyltransferase family 1 protein [Ramlibacter cellulosilyticus]
MANVALVGFGSVGDLHPLLAIGAHLRTRGHQVVVLTNPRLAHWVAQAGLVLEPVGSADEYDAAMRHPRIWHPVDGLGVFWRYLLRGALRPTYAVLERLQRTGRWVAVASPVAMGARIAQEALRLPLISVYTAATMLRSVRHPLTLAAWRVPRLVPEAVLQLAWKALDARKLQPLVLPALEDLRGGLGLPPLARSVFGEWMHSPLAGVALFPGWFAPAAADWPPQVRQAGFALYGADAREGLSPALQEFLDAGSAPVVFAPGTGAFQPEAFHRAAVQACIATGRRGVLTGVVAPDLLATLPASMHATPYAPFPLLLPRVSALVHHGGIGSCAQALRAGIPQLVVPQGYDQFDNAMRIEALGAGASVGAAGLHRLPGALERLLATPAATEAARRLAPRVTAEAALEQVATLVEAHA